MSSDTALVVGLCATELTITSGDISVRRLALGSIAGFAAAIVTGVAVSMVGGGDRSRGREFVARLLRADGDVLEPDKGA